MCRLRRHDQKYNAMLWGRLRPARLPVGQGFGAQGQDLALALLDVIAPPRCVGCLQEGTWMCTPCRQREMGMSALFSQRCIVCEDDQPRGVTCFSCREDTSLHGAISAGPYQSLALRRGISWLKFRGVKSVAEIMAYFLVPKLWLMAPLEQLQTEALIVPMPLSARRLRQRGFNQSQELANHLSRLTNIPVSSPLARTRATHAQTQLPHELRKQNVAEAFAVTGDIPPAKYILLLDDVATTGSTLSSAAAALQTSSSAQMWGLTVARG